MAPASQPILLTGPPPPTPSRLLPHASPVGRPKLLAPAPAASPRASGSSSAVIIGRHTPELYWAIGQASTVSAKQARIWVDKQTNAPHSPALLESSIHTAGLVVLVQCIGKNPCVIQRHAPKGKHDLVPAGSVLQLAPFDTLWLVHDVCPLRLCVQRTARSDRGELPLVPRLACRELLLAMHDVMAAHADHSDRGAALLSGTSLLLGSPAGTHVSSSMRSSAGGSRDKGLAAAGGGGGSQADPCVVVVDGSSRRKRERSADSQPVLIAPPGGLVGAPCTAVPPAAQDDEGNAAAARHLLYAEGAHAHQESGSSGSLPDDLTGCDSQLAQLEAYANMPQRRPTELAVGWHVGRVAHDGLHAATACYQPFHGAAIAPIAPPSESQFVFFDHN